MKKILLGTTALVGVVLASQAALADGPKVTVGGDSEFEAGLIGDDQGGGFTTSGGTHENGEANRAFYTRNEISFKVDGKSDAGLGYGGEVWLQADTSSDTYGRGVNAERTFVYLDGMWGRTELGSNYGADETLKIDASSIARATGGIAGDWLFFANNRNGNAFLATPDLPLNYGITATGGECNSTTPNASGFGNQCEENLNKVTYYTPKWNGLQAGLTYTPNDDSRGQIVNTTDYASGAVLTGAGSGTANAYFAPVNNIWQGGVNWTGNWDQVGLGVGGTAERGSAELTNYNDLWAWQLGAKASYMGFSAAGSYADWSDSLREKGIGAGDTKDWTLGAAYEYGPYGASVTYLNGKMAAGTTGQVIDGSDKFTNVVFGTDYKLAPGLTPYAELSFFDENANGTGPTYDNSGHVFLLGTQLNF